MPWFFIQLRYMKPFLSVLPNHWAERSGRLSVIALETCAIARLMSLAVNEKGKRATRALRRNACSPPVRNRMEDHARSPSPLCQLSLVSGVIANKYGFARYGYTKRYVWAPRTTAFLPGNSGNWRATLSRRSSRRQHGWALFAVRWRQKSLRLQAHP